MNQVFSDHKIIKLINGEDIICTLAGEKLSAGFETSTISVDHPLKMQIIPKMTDKGIAESLSLSHWVHPYTESCSFNIPSTSVLLIADVSPGLSRYYEFVLGKMKNADQGPTEVVTEEDVYDDLLEEMEVDSDLIH